MDHCFRALHCHYAISKPFSSTRRWVHFISPKKFLNRTIPIYLRTRLKKKWVENKSRKLEHFFLRNIRAKGSWSVDVFWKVVKLSSRFFHWIQITYFTLGNLHSVELKRGNSIWILIEPQKNRTLSSHCGIILLNSKVIYLILKTLIWD